jgi:hypothetical protein
MSVTTSEPMLRTLPDCSPALSLPGWAGDPGRQERARGLAVGAAEDVDR